MLWNIDLYSSSGFKTYTVHQELHQEQVTKPGTTVLTYHRDMKKNSDIEDISLGEFQAKKLPILKELCLGGLINSGQNLQDFAQRVVKWDLGSLEIPCHKSISGNLSVLFHQRFPSLMTLNLSECELTSDDTRCLTDAREQGRLPKLQILNVSKNRIRKADMWKENEVWKNVNTDKFRQEFQFP